jgi:hypothetical protein
VRNVDVGWYDAAMSVRATCVAAIVIAGVARAAPPLPAHVAPMFELGRTWTYALALTTWGGDGSEPPGKIPKVTEHARATCTVIAAAQRPAARLSLIACDAGGYRKLRIAGWYAANARGLWSLPYEAPGDDDIADALEQAPLIAGSPVASRTISHLGGLDPKHDTIVAGVRAQGRAWCTYADSSDADPDGGTVSTCFTAGVGISSGLDDTGGELNRFEYTLQASSSR